MKGKIAAQTVWKWEHWRNGKLIDEWEEKNICVDEGLNYMLDAAFSGGTPITSWYILLFGDNYNPQASDTYASPGFSETSDYDETTRPAWSENGVNTKQITNSASKAQFTMGGVQTTIYGAALVSDDTKGDTVGGGKMFCASKFSSAKTGIEDNDVLKVGITLTASNV